MDAIKIDSLVKNYGKHRGVSGISFSVQKGDFFGFIGPNGAGKSTTIRTMLGLISATSGEMSILGMNTRKNQVAVLEKIGYMPSETMFYPSLKVDQVIKMAAQAYHMDCTERAEQLCERLKVDVHKRIDELSLGNRKKVSIVCTMQHAPDLYIFDEPTSGLDPLMQKEFFELLQEENERGATIFFSSHVLSEIQNYCNKAAIIKEGRLVALDTVSNLSKTNARKVKIRGMKELPVIEGIRNPQLDNQVLSFLYQGSSKELIQVLANQSFEDVIIEEPTLEEIFMHFYENEQAEAKKEVHHGI